MSAVCCSVLQCVAMCCSVLQCVAVKSSWECLAAAAVRAPCVWVSHINVRRERGMLAFLYLLHSHSFTCSTHTQFGGWKFCISAKVTKCALAARLSESWLLRTCTCCSVTRALLCCLLCKSTTVACAAAARSACVYNKRTYMNIAIQYMHLHDCMHVDEWIHTMVASIHVPSIHVCVHQWMDGCRWMHPSDECILESRHDMMRHDMMRNTCTHHITSSVHTSIYQSHIAYKNASTRVGDIDVYMYSPAGYIDV